MADVMLYDQFGREIDLAKNKKPDRTPLAVAPLLDSFREYVTDGLTPERLARVFKAADMGDVRSQAELFDQLEEKDGHLLCERDKRKNVILDLEFNIEPASDDSRDVKIAEFVEEFFDDLADWEDSLTAVQDAVGKGFSAQEIFWDVSEGQAVPTKLEFIEQKRFMYTDESGILRKYPRLLTDDDPMGVEIQPWKIMLHQYGGKSGHSARSGIYRVASWMVLFKHYAIKDWVIFCEVFGMPLRLGKYSPGATEDDKAALVAAISSLGSDAAGIISKSTEIEFVETVKTAGSDLYKVLGDFCNAEISKALLGQTLSSQVGDKGSYAASKTHNEVRLDLLKADGRAAAATVRNQLIRPLVGFNFGWDTALPKYKSVYDEDEDLVAKTNWMDKAVSQVQVPAKWYREELGIPEPEEDEEVIGGTVDSDQGKIYKYHLDHKIVKINEAREKLGLEPVADGDRFPEPLEKPFSKQEAKLIAAKQGLIDSAPDTVESLVSVTTERAEMNTMIDPIKELLDQAESLEEFRDRLLEIYSHVSEGEMAKVMQRALSLAEISGRFDVEAENGL